MKSVNTGNLFFTTYKSLMASKRIFWDLTDVEKMKEFLNSDMPLHIFFQPSPVRLLTLYCVLVMF